MKEKSIIIDERTVHSFSALLAIKLGIEKSILLYNLEYWINYNTANEKNFFDGKYWTYNSADAFQKKLFPYMSAPSIARYLRELENDGYLLSTSKLNKNPHDRTKWYSLTEAYFALFKMQPYIYQNDKCTTQNDKCTTQNDKCTTQNDKCTTQNDKSYTDILPNVNTEVNTDKKQVMSPEGDTPAFEVLNDEACMQKNDATDNDVDSIKQKTINAQELKGDGAGVNDLIESKSKENSLFNNNNYTNNLIASTARKTFEGLSGVMQSRVLEVVNAFREITGKRDSLTKERLGCILARLKEDVFIDGEDVKIQILHFKTVFEYMNAKWCNDTKMKQYVQIETFCSQKMHKYLEEANAYQQSKQNTPQKETIIKKKKTLVVV